jgi:hypothetical protein
MRGGNDQRQGCIACMNHLNNPLPHCGGVQTDCQVMTVRVRSSVRHTKCGRALKMSHMRGGMTVEN